MMEFQAETERPIVNCLGAYFAAEFSKRDWSDDRIYGRNGIGARLLDREDLAAEMTKRNYSPRRSGKFSVAT